MEPAGMNSDVVISPFVPQHAAQVRALFIAINRLLSPRYMRNAFEAYIERSLTEEIDRIGEYYAERDGGFWVALKGDNVVGMFGLERVSASSLELRRMYVDPSAQRGGIARRMLQYAEAECRRRQISRLELSTSELQEAALDLYRSAGYTLTRDETAVDASNKTVGAGIHRYYFEKLL
jgi:GNAT superfamily N-acetyltransferase